MLKLGIDPEKLYQTTFMAYVVAIWPLFLFDSFVKNWNTCENFLGKWLTAPHGKKFPVRLCPFTQHCSTLHRSLPKDLNQKN